MHLHKGHMEKQNKQGRNCSILCPGTRGPCSLGITGTLGFVGLKEPWSETRVPHWDLGLEGPWPWDWYHWDFGLGNTGTKCNY